MANLARYTQRVFGALAGFQQMAEFGALQAGFPANRYDGATITPALVQGLGNYDGGWYDAVQASYSPAIEDMNALCYLFSYQLTYLEQVGIPEYDAATTYNIGSIVQYNVGLNTSVIYKCIADTTLGVAPNTDPAKWTSPILPDGFRVGAEDKAGLVTQTIENDSFAAGVVGSVLRVVSGQSTGSGTSGTNLYKLNNGGSFIENTDPAGDFRIHLKRNGGALDIIMDAQNTGIVNFKYGATSRDAPVFTTIKIINVDFSLSPYAYTPSNTNVAYVIFEFVGGGGGGGGAGTIGGLGFLSAANGGGSAGYAKFVTYYSRVSGGVTITIGNKGTGGIGAGTGLGINGIAGGDTTLVTVVGTETIGTANGGGGGTAHSASAGGQIPLQGGAGSLATIGGFGITGTIIQGGFSGNVLATSDTIGFAGDGGGSWFGPGGRGGVTTGFVSMAGGNAISYGSGGGGAVLTNGGAVQNGGNGKEGYCIIMEIGS